jgi:hypothetical protein
VTFDTWRELRSDASCGVRVCRYEFKEASLSNKPAWFTEIYRQAVGAEDHDGAVPVIVDGDFTLAESAIIAQCAHDIPFSARVCVRLSIFIHLCVRLV